MDLGRNDLRMSNTFTSGSNVLIERPPPSENQDYPRGIINPIDKQSVMQSLNVDSRFRDNYYGTSSSDFQVNLPTKIKRVVEMQLGEIEIPVSFYSISARLGNNYFWVRENGGGTTKCIIIPDGNYSGADLVQYINDELNRSPIISTITFVFDETSSGSGTGRIVAARNTPVLTPTNFELNFSAPISQTNDTDVYDTNDTATPLQLKLGWLMGYRYPKYINSSAYTSEGLFDTQSPRYLYLVIDDFNNNSNNSLVTAFNSSILSKCILARISLKQISNNIADNDYGLASNPPTRSYFGPVDIQKLRVQVIDEYGRILNMNNMDISFVLNFSCLVSN